MRTARVIRLWGGRHEKHIRIPGPGEDTFNADVIILPVIRIERAPPRTPRRTRKRKTS